VDIQRSGIRLQSNRDDSKDGEGGKMEVDKGHKISSLLPNRFANHMSITLCVQIVPMKRGGIASPHSASAAWTPINGNNDMV
jgi:hypothetical protein